MSENYRFCAFFGEFLDRCFGVSANSCVFKNSPSSWIYGRIEINADENDFILDFDIVQSEKFRHLAIASYNEEKQRESILDFG
jgi:hypothetical protein